MSSLTQNVHGCFHVVKGNVTGSGLVNIILDLLRDRHLPYHINNIKWMLYVWISEFLHISLEEISEFHIVTSLVHDLRN